MFGVQGLGGSYKGSGAGFYVITESQEPVSRS